MDFSKKLLGYFLSNNQTKTNFFWVFTWLRNKFKKFILAVYSNTTILNGYLQKLFTNLYIILIISFLVDYSYTYIYSPMSCVFHSILLNYQQHLLQSAVIRIYDGVFLPSHKYLTLGNILKIWFYKYFLLIGLLFL